MRYLITFFLVLLSYCSYGQIVGTQVLAFKGNVTTTIRNGLDVPTGEYWMIYNTTTAQLEVSDDTDTWTAFTAGTDDQTAAEVAFTPYSTIAATDVQGAIQEALDEAVGTDDQTASEVPITDAGGIITATDVEGALQENRTAIDLNTAKVSSVFSGSIADTQVAFGTGADAIGGDADLTYNSTTNLLTAGGYFTSGNFEGRRIIYNTAGASTDEWVIQITNEENPEMLFYMHDGGYPGGSVTESYSLHVGNPTDPADIIKLEFLQAGLDDLAGVLDASAFSGNLATTDDTLQELADAVDGLVLGGGGLANVVEDTTPQLGGDLDAVDNDITDLNLLRISNTTGANTMSMNFIADSDTAWGLTPLGGANIQYSFSSGGWTFPILDTADYYTANNVETALAELGAGIASGGSGDHSLSAENQAIATAVARTVNTEGTGTLSFNQVGTELMRIGNNNDDAVYVLNLEALTGNTIGLTSPFALPEVDTGANAASGYTGAIVKDTGVLYYSNGATWEVIGGGIAGTIPGRTGTAVDEVMIQTQAQYNSDGAPASGEVVFISDAKTPEVIQIACSDLTTNVTTGTSKAYFRMPWAATLTDVRVSLLAAGTATGLTVDINESGTTVLSTKLTTDATEATSETATTAAVISDAALADDAIITIDFDAVPTAGKGVIVTLYVEY